MLEAKAHCDASVLPPSQPNEIPKDTPPGKAIEQADQERDLPQKKIQESQALIDDYCQQKNFHRNKVLNSKKVLEAEMEKVEECSKKMEDQ